MLLAMTSFVVGVWLGVALMCWMNIIADNKMDDADRASKDDELSIAEAMRRSVRPTGPAPKGACYWCDEPLEHPLRWCPEDECHERWERANRGRR